MALDETGAGRVATASTAEGAATLRAAGAAEPDPEVRNPDHLAARFVGFGLRLPALVKVPGARRLASRVAERMVPGSFYFETARTHHLDALLRAELGRGVTQVVLLGAGYDSRAYRFAGELDGTRVFEVDHPAMSQIKQDKVRRIAGGLPAHVSYVAVDFTRDDLAERLAANGYDRDAPTLLIWSGVVPYIPEQAVRDVLEFVASHGSPGTSICFDYCFQEALENPDDFYGAPELLPRLAEMGEPLVFGIPRGTIARFLESTGLRLEEDLGPEEATRRYLIRSDGRVYGRLYGFGGFVQARVAQPRST